MKKSVYFPEQVFIFGGGRWARVIAGVLSSLLPNNTPLTLCSRRGAAALQAWTVELGLSSRIAVAQEWPEKFPSGRTAVIVANAASEHVAAGLWALERGASVLIEKPLATSLIDAHNIAHYAKSRSSLLAVAHVLLYTRYLTNFSNMLPAWEDINSIKLEWVDSVGEERNGEYKQYDSSVPVFVDCLPHAISALQSVFGFLPELVALPTVEKGGSKITFPLTLDGKPCSICLQRNGPTRIRRLSVITTNGELTLDFSLEPGVIWQGGERICADFNWNSAERPLASLLETFLKASVAGESIDTRLSLNTAFTACAIADAVMLYYRFCIKSWLVDHVSLGKELNDAVRYALIELIQIGGRIPQIELEDTEALLNIFFLNISAADN